MNARLVISEDAVEQFYAIPIELQDPLDERLARLAEIEATRDLNLPPGSSRRFRYHEFTLDLGDQFWHTIAIRTLFHFERGVMEVLSIGLQTEEK